MDIGMLIRRISAKCHPAAYLFVPVIQLKDRLEGGRMHRSLEENIANYCSEEQKRNPAALRRLKRDMWYSFILYHANFSEYFVYRFPRLSHEGRREFVTEAEKNALCEKLSSPEVQRVIWDKWSAYNLFREFYRRDAIRVDTESAPEEFAAFITAHPRFIAKPRLESCGMGVTIYDSTAADFDSAAVFAALQNTGVICEELIAESDALAALHPSSVNTVRVATFMKDGSPVVLFTFLRVGRGNSIVDNGGAGGFVALIDPETGIVTTPGVTERLYEAVTHPDTGVPIIGKQIPDWQEALDLARKAALVYPDHPYISWDLAHTKDGWLMVEANCMGQFIGPQFTTGRGCRAHLSRYFDL